MVNTSQRKQHRGLKSDQVRRKPLGSCYTVFLGSRHKRGPARCEEWDCVLGFTSSSRHTAPAMVKSLGKGDRTGVAALARLSVLELYRGLGRGCERTPS